MLIDSQVTDRENFQQVLISDRLRLLLAPQIAALVKRVGDSLCSVQVRELGYCWGSCGHKGDLFFHAPCGDVAELAHLRMWWFTSWRI